MPAAMMAMTCQESHAPAAVSRRNKGPSTALPRLCRTMTKEAASVADRPARPATRALTRPEASRPSTSSSGSRASRVVM